MLIYFCLIIPIIAVALLAWKYHSKMAWWEYLIVFGVPIICILIGKFASTITQTADTEVWNSYLVQATHYEDWDEWIEKTCYHTCYDKCTNSDGSTYDCNPHDCNPYDCSYRDYHPEYWEAVDNIGGATQINQGFYEQLCKKWGNKSFRDMHRDYYLDDGDAYDTKADTSFAGVAPRTTRHIYENRVKCSRSVFNFAEVDSEDVKDFGLFKYPAASEYNYNPILGWHDPAASLRLQRYNARLGSWKQVHMMIIVFKDKPVQAALLQEGYWKGGNKNEFTLCIGVRDKKIEWAKTISWTEVDELKIGVEKTVVSMPIDMSKIVDYMANEVQKKFIRKQFADFSYITVEPTTGAVVITFFVTIIFTVGLSIFCVLNPFDQEGKSYGRTMHFHH
jgi:hypothetical protein